MQKNNNKLPTMLDHHHYVRHKVSFKFLIKEILYFGFVGFGGS
jgi:hypothetical protein